MEFYRGLLNTAKKNHRIVFGESDRPRTAHAQENLNGGNEAQRSECHCPQVINGNFRILKWRYVSTICLAIFCGDIP